LLARPAAIHRPHQLAVLRRDRCIALRIVRVDDGHDMVDGIVSKEDVERPAEYGNACNFLVLLGNVGARDAGPAPGGNDDGGIGHDAAIKHGRGKRGQPALSRALPQRAF
jgi:hypothetical protein